jgi:hypothetical protein
MPRWSTSFKEILSCAHWNFEEQNKVLESSIIINYFIIIINAYYNYMINAYYGFYVCNKCLFEESDKEENLEVNGAASTSSSKRRL